MSFNISEVMERFIEIAIITAQATYMVDTLEAMEAQRKFLRKVNEPIKRIEVRCYEREDADMWGDGEDVFDDVYCICKQVIWSEQISK
jgi:hypothetical protein